MQSYELVLGPQDGAKVPEVGGKIPSIIFVGPKWLGDGYATWSRKRSDRFPECYIKQSDGKYYHEYRLEVPEELLAT